MDCRENKIYVHPMYTAFKYKRKQQNTFDFNDFFIQFGMHGLLNGLQTLSKELSFFT
jgi:hypothetical protein